ncbi:MAG: BrnT family toxin [Deltaproteobacteria bacterium]|nr:BrnT family toxin [Deltaproteobacteria bacterium]
MTYTFEWDFEKELQNIQKHGVTFDEALQVFTDPKVIHLEDESHSSEEDRYYAVGKTYQGCVLTVRYPWRKKVIRIFGAAYWRKWRKFYEKNT